MNKVMVFVLSIIFLASCEGVNDYLNNHEEEIEIDLPEGSGAIQVLLSAGEARTIMPSGSLSSFNHFSYFFTKSGGAQTEITPQNNNFFVLEQGSYQVTVNAYMTQGEGSLAAQGTSGTFSISSGQTSPAVSITMHPYVTGEGTGTFEFFLQYPAGAVVETFRLVSKTGSAVYNLTGTVSDSNPIIKSGSMAVPVGYYNLEVQIKSVTGEYAGKVETVHIYRNMVTIVKPEDYTFIASDFPANRTPAVSDYTFSGAGTYTYNGNPRAVTVTASSNASPGAVSVFYTGTGATSYPQSQGAPVNAGTYSVTFNVAAANGWNQATGLSAGTVTINKANGATVNRPVLNNATNSTITVNAVAAPSNGQTVEYARNTSSAVPASGWQDGTTFSGLNPVTTYYIFARSKQNDNYNNGTASSSLSVTTLGTAGITVNFWINEDSQILGTNPANSSITISKGSNQSFTATVTSNYSNIEWFVQGKSAGTSRSITIKAADYINGTYRLNVLVERAGIPFSSEIRFTVTN